MKKYLLGVFTGLILTSTALFSFDNNFLVSKNLSIEQDRQDVISAQYAAGESISSAELNYKFQAIDLKIDAVKTKAIASGGALCEGSAIVEYDYGSNHYKFDACKMKAIWSSPGSNGQYSVSIYGSFSFGHGALSSQSGINVASCIGAGGISLTGNQACMESDVNTFQKLNRGINPINITETDEDGNVTAYSDVIAWVAGTKAGVNPR